MDQQDSNKQANQEADRQGDRWRSNSRSECCGIRSENSWRGLFFGLVLILLGVLFFAAMQDWLSWGSWWQYFLVGLGAIFLIDALIHSINSSGRKSVFGRVITGLILITVGLAFAFQFEQWWPLILIVTGVAIVSRIIFKRR